jgi:DNA-binding SARP family transcriptional activator
MNDGPQNRLQIRLLGQLSIGRNGETVSLPASRKVRALLAYLAMHDGVARSTLCDLFWEVPNDPRGELRWCLSKLRGVVDDEHTRRVETSNDRIVLNISDCFVDALQIDGALKPGVALLDLDALRTVCDLFGGEFLEGLQLSGSARFNSWVVTQRHRYKALQLSVLARLCELLDSDSEEYFRRLNTWLQVSPFDLSAHERMMTALAASGRIPDAEAHSAAAIRQFEAEGLDWMGLREMWRKIRAKAVAPTQITEKNREPRVVASTHFHQSARQIISPGNAVQRRASVAVMPFVERPSNGVRGGLADGLVDDIITRLAKLRTYFVIARGTVFALAERNIGPQEAGQILNVNYIVSGFVARQPDNVSISVELVDTRDGRIQWAEEFNYPAQDACAAMSNVGDRIVAALAEEIEGAERNRAVLKEPSSLDAWEAYHRGLWHMYRFSGEDNSHAEQFFHSAIRLDPTFARAHAGLSFTHFQNAFLNLKHDADEQTELAFQAAGRSLMADDRDPAAHCAMGRAMWLRGNQEEALRELSRSVELSPNFSLGHYTTGFVQAQSGDPRAALEAIDFSRSLSPFDPMQFAMLATNALSHIRLGNYDEAASWALKAISRPNAHKHISSIAVHCLAAANRLDEARAIAALLRRNDSNYQIDRFLGSFRFDKDTADLFRRSAQRIGLT